MSQLFTLFAILSLATDATSYQTVMKPYALREDMLVFGAMYVEPVSGARGPMQWKLGSKSAKWVNPTDDACELQGVTRGTDCSLADQIFFYRHTMPAVAAMLFETGRGTFFATYDPTLERGVVYERQGGEWNEIEKVQGASGLPYLESGPSGKVTFPRGRRLRAERIASTGESLGVTREGRLVYRKAHQESERLIDDPTLSGGGRWELLSLDGTPSDTRMACLRTLASKPEVLLIDLKTGTVERRWTLPLPNAVDGSSPWRRPGWGSVVRSRDGTVFVISIEVLHWKSGTQERAEFLAVSLASAEPKAYAVPVE